MTESEISALTSQLHGVMDCSDFISLCHVLKLGRLEKVHKVRLNKILCIYQKTNGCMIDKYQEIAYIPVNFEKVITGNLVIDEKDKLQWISKMLSSWETWAETAMELYWKLSVEDVENKKWWVYLYNLHKLDLKESKTFQRKLIPGGYETENPIQTVKQKLQAKLSAQRQTSETE